MNKSKSPLDIVKTSKDDSYGAITTIALVSIIFAATFTSDHNAANRLLILPLLISTLISTLITQWGIPKLRALKLSQIIRKEGPKKHYNKAGTPTMGGLLIVPIGLIVGNLAAIKDGINHQLLALSFLTLSFMFIGMLDDWRSLSLNTSTGLRPKGKLALQTMVGILFLIWASSQELVNTKIYLVSNISIELGILIWPLALFVLLAESNATNLTDGLDGLASGCGAIIFTGISIELILRGGLENYGLASFCMAMTGSWLGFLIFNRSPARIFMGDTGSLSMGATLAGVALISNTLWSLLIMGIVFLAESVSVILQVGIFKATKYTRGKGFRLFRMAPLHHHFELKGNKEIEIVHSFWLISLIFVCLGLVLRSNI